MDKSRLSLLRAVLLVKVVVTLAAWGLPALLAPPALFALLGIPFPSDPVFVRLFGAVVTAVGLAYWYAYRDPLRNVAIIRFGVLDNALASLTVVALWLTGHPLGWFFLVSCALTVAFTICFLWLMPHEQMEAARG